MTLHELTIDLVSIGPVRSDEQLSHDKYLEASPWAGSGMSIPDWRPPASRWGVVSALARRDRGFPA
ncbi:hypothetical protein [Nocardia sp. NPDC006630]|uniref:hypothetical protein n=1 Tax=Nocardia sp. NPDC006630 TaxID=3157181 RepID=UPI0033A81847